MSWNVARTALDPDEVQKTLVADYSEFRGRYVDAGGDAAIVAMNEQFNAALSAAQVVIAAGAVGRGRVNVTLSGHANPEHRSREGYAPEGVHISISAAGS